MSRWAVFRATNCRECRAGRGRSCHKRSGSRRSPHSNRLVRYRELTQLWGVLP